MEVRTGLQRKPFFYILLVIFIFWIILFELILPGNNIIPKPYTVLLSFPALFEDYHFTTNFLTTLSAVYLPALLAYLGIFALRGTVIKRSGILRYITGFISKLLVFFPPFLLAVLFVFWFPDSYLIEYIFSFIVAVLWWLTEIESKLVISNENYRLAFRSFGADESFINKNILWNEIRPLIFKNLVKFHLHLWAVILVFEYISAGNGIGSVLHQTLIFHDLSALCMVIFIIAVIIYAGYIFLKFIENRFIFWSAE